MKHALLALCLTFTPFIAHPVLAGPEPLKMPTMVDKTDLSISGMVDLKAADGTEINLRYWYQNDARASVVVVHGLKDHSGRYNELAKRLNALGYSVYAIDLRGHGISGGERQYIASFSDYLGDLDTAIKSAHEFDPDLPILLFGHSMGGAVATLYALDHQSELAGLMLSAPALKEGKDVSPFLIGVTRALSGWLPGLPVLHLEHASFSRDPGVLADIAADPLIEKGDGPARTAAELLGALETIQRREHELKLPLLILHGDADGLTNPDGSLQLFRESASTRKTLRIYPKLYHILLDEPEKSEVYADITAWLNSLKF